MMKPLYIFDLDGTLALIDHRRHLVEGPGKDWQAFFAACVDDVPNGPVLDTFDFLRTKADLQIWSGRSDEVASETIHWLGVRAEIPRVTLSLTPSQPAPDQVLLRMRPAGDFTPDEELKRSWLHAMPADDRRRLVAVFDDRDKVVEMWRKEGLTCFQVAPGGF